jgi:hypothetical protein
MVSHALQKPAIDKQFHAQTNPSYPLPKRIFIKYYDEAEKGKGDDKADADVDSRFEYFSHCPLLSLGVIVGE